MIIAKQLSLETWNPPDIGSTIPIPQWTRLSCDGLELSNSIEWADWKSDPIAPTVCESSWETNYWWKTAHLVRTDSQLLWLQCYYSEIPKNPWFGPEQDPLEDSVLIDRVFWDEVCTKLAELPRFDSIRRITSRDLWALWEQQLPPCTKPDAYKTIAQHLWAKCIASHPIDRDQTVPLVLQLLDAKDHATTPREGTLVPIDRERDNIQAFYFDADDFPEWLAFTVDPPHHPVIANQWILRR